MSTTQQQQQQRSGNPAFGVIDTYASISPGQFESNVDKNWSALEAIKDQVTQSVTRGEMTPLQGVGILACTTAQLFGYQAFHGQPSLTETLSVWSNGQQYGQKPQQQR